MNRSWTHLTVLIAGLALAGFLEVTMIAKQLDLEGDVGAYISGAVGVLEGTNIYERNLAVPGPTYVYPPLLAILLAPAVALGPRIAVLFWSIASLAAVIASGCLLCRCVEDRGSRWRLVLLVLPGFLALRFLDSNFGNGQANSLILLSFSLTAYGLAKKRAWLAGLAVGFGTAVKIVPVGLLAYILLRRQWKVAAVSVFVTLVLGLALPLAVLGPRRMRDTYRAFGGILHGLSVSPGHDLSVQGGYVPGQSLRPMAFRFLRPTDTTLKPSRGDVQVNFVTLSGPTTEAIYRGVAIAVMGLGLALWYAGRKRIPNRILFDLSVAALVLVIAAPYARKAYFVILILPFTFLLNELHGISRACFFRNVALALACFVLLVVSTARFDVTPPFAPFLALAGAAVLLCALEHRDRILFGTAYATAITAFTARGFVGKWMTYRLLAICIVGFSALFLLTLLFLYAFVDRRKESADDDLSRESLRLAARRT